MNYQFWKDKKKARHAWHFLQKKINIALHSTKSNSALYPNQSQQFKPSLKIALFFLLIFSISCRNQDSPKTIAASVDAKIDSAVLLMYKLYSDCETSILENNNGKIDTIAKDVSYLCLPVKIEAPEIHGDTTVITMFFEPERGYEIENPKSEFAYAVGFIGSDSQFDFVVFGDNYYTLSASQLIKSKPNMERIFNKTVARNNCMCVQLKRLLHVKN